MRRRNRPSSFPRVQRGSLHPRMKRRKIEFVLGSKHSYLRSSFFASFVLPLAKARSARKSAQRLRSVSLHNLWRTHIDDTLTIHKHFYTRYWIFSHGSNEIVERKVKWIEGKGGISQVEKGRSACYSHFDAWNTIDCCTLLLFLGDAYLLTYISSREKGSI